VWKLGNILTWFGLTVAGVTYIFGALGAIASAYAASGALGVSLAVVLVSAIPAVIVGALLGERRCAAQRP
jgi:hypothetical protein